MKTLVTLLACAASALVASSARAQVIVYDNLANPLNLYLNELNAENGDWIQLSSGPTTITSFTFQYWLDATKLVGGETMEVRFYRMDGPQLAPGDPTPTPGSQFFDSGLINLTLADAGVVTKTFSGLNVVAPGDFTWTVQFSGGNVSGGLVAGPTLYSPPVVGQNTYEFWQRTTGAWDLNYFDANPTDFGAQVTAVPEPAATAVVLLLSGVGTVALLRRRRGIA